MAETIDNGLKFGEDQSAEVQIENLLAGPRANYKLALDMTENFSPYFAMAEEYLWPSGKDNRRTPGRMSRSGQEQPVWPWMPGTGGLDALKADALKQGSGASVRTATSRRVRSRKRKRR